MTSPPREIEVVCPKCGHEYKDWYRPSINSTLDPEMAGDEDDMSEATSATCPECGHRVPIEVLLADW
jgi:DNA-directed RNA polymerase subunit RPC12/RpoP